MQDRISAQSGQQLSDAPTSKWHCPLVQRPHTRVAALSRISVFALQKAMPPAVNDIGAAGETDISERTALSLRNLAAVSFWTQLSLSVVSGIILFFAIQSGSVRYVCRACTESEVPPRCHWQSQ